MGGNSTNKGTVQVCLNNKYGTICDQDQSFDNKAAAVTCGYLGFPRQGTGEGGGGGGGLICQGAKFVKLGNMYLMYLCFIKSGNYRLVMAYEMLL